MATTLTHKTALCIIPPENLWEPIQSIRSVHDKAYPRWMPHINLIYPFVPETEFGRIKTQLDSILNASNAFDIEFDATSFQYFKQKSECTFHLRPNVTKAVCDLQKLIQDELVKSLPINSRPFEAHLTLGQTTTSRISDLLIEMKAKWQSMRFPIDRVYLISRENDPNDLFSIKSQILLVGNKTEETNKEKKEQQQPIPINTNTSRPIKRNTSSKLYLCAVPPDEFSSRLMHLFEDTSFRPVKPFRIVLAEYETKPNELELRLKFSSIDKFTINFGARSICFNYSTARLFLKPTSLEALRQFNPNSDPDFDGTLTLGELDKADLTNVGNRFTEAWKLHTNEFEVAWVHLIDSDGRFQSTFRLKTQCFS